jgi:ActR/RegA family two-component response regulator
MSKKILIVDDEAMIRDLFKRLLSPRGYEVIACKEGEEAVKLMREKNPQLAFVDLRLPAGMDGIETLKKLKSINPDCETIIITGYASIESAIETMKSGAYDYILKPFSNIRDIIELVRKALEKQELVAKNKRLQNEIRFQRDQLQGILDRIVEDLGEGVIVWGEKDQLLVVNSMASTILGFKNRPKTTATDVNERLKALGISLILRKPLKIQIPVNNSKLFFSYVPIKGQNKVYLGAVALIRKV